MTLKVNENKFHMTYTKIRNNNIYNYFMFSTVGLKTQIVFLSKVKTLIYNVLKLRN